MLHVSPGKLAVHVTPNQHVVSFSHRLFGNFTSDYFTLRDKCFDRSNPYIFFGRNTGLRRKIDQT